MNGTRPAQGFCHIKGYKYLTGMQDHPLATRGSGQITEHRVVLYDAIGPGPHPCHWCDRPLNWGGRTGLQADHLDGVKTNNDITNLVPSCISCNRRRAAAGNPPDWQP